ncbi:uncharacterized protein [Cicer arietinum]|uniref:uncharacterized protein n=1 Tax=Cicer arietinum TaxID=3827 RepID=UPI003CC505D5
MAQRTSGNLPSDTVLNPRNNVNAVTTRSGKVREQVPPEAEQSRSTLTPTHREEMVTPISVEERIAIEKEEEPVVQKGEPLPKPEIRLPFPQRLRREETEKQFGKFLDVFKKLHINIPFAEALEQMPTYAKFMKDILSKKRKIGGETVMLTEECSAILQRKLPPKLKDPGSFSIPCAIGNRTFGKALCDLGASVSLMPLSIYKKLGIGKVKDTQLMLQFADRSMKHPYGVVEDVLVKVDKFIFPVDFVVLDMEEDNDIPLILGRPFLATGRAMIDVADGTLTLKVNEETVTFNILKAMEHSKEREGCNRIEILDEIVNEEIKHHTPSLPLERVLCLPQDVVQESEDPKMKEVWAMLEASPSYSPCFPTRWEDLKGNEDKSAEKKTPLIELKQLPLHLKYVFLGEEEKNPAIISASLSELQEDKLLRILRKHKGAIGWSIDDLKGISPTFCMHKILMEDNHKSVVQPQRRLNPVMKEVIRKEVVKLLEAGLIYPISDSSWVSPVQVVPKKGGTTVITNEKNELIPTRTVTGWRVCIDYRRLNSATRKDHFPLPFIDQMLERLAGHEYYCFLDGYSGYNQIAVAPGDQEKTAFTCPYGVFAYRRMPFGLCNAPATFQRCMMSKFSDMIEKHIEVFMDDFSVFGSSFDNCLINPSLVLERCEKSNLVLNWEKCHFMVREGIVLGHRISHNGIEVDKAKVEVIEKLPPTNEKGIRSFLGHAGFHRRFIKDFSKIAKPLTNLLAKDTPYKFNEDCLHAFNNLKNQLITAPIITAPDWNQNHGCLDGSYYYKNLTLRSGIKRDRFEINLLMSTSLPLPRYLGLPTLLISRWGGTIPSDFTYQQRKKFIHDAKFYVWDEPFLYKRGVDGLLRRCVPEEEQEKVMWHCHDSEYGGHFSGDRTAARVLQSGLFWPSLFKDTFNYVKKCDRCQRTGNISKRDEMPQNPVLEVEVFDVWGYHLSQEEHIRSLRRASSLD